MNKEQIDQCFRILGCEPGSTLAEVKAEYRNLAQVFHPDKYEAGSTRQEWAASRFVQINDAYEKLKAFFEKYPDGVPTDGWEAQSANQTTPANGSPEPAKADEDGFIDWGLWQSATRFATELSLAEWTKEQEHRTKTITTEDGRNNRRKLVKYGKLVACVFVCLIWVGRVNSSSLTKIALDTEKQNLQSQQAYDLERQGTNLDGFAWSNSDLDKRHQDEVAELNQKYEQKSGEIAVSGWATTFLTLFIIWALVAPNARKYLNNWTEGKSDETT